MSYDDMLGLMIGTSILAVIIGYLADLCLPSGVTAGGNCRRSVKARSLPHS